MLSLIKSYYYMILLILCFNVNGIPVNRISWDIIPAAKNQQIEKEIIQYKLKNELMEGKTTDMMEDTERSNEMDVCSESDDECTQYQTNNASGRNNAEAKEDFVDPNDRDICETFKKFGDSGAADVDDAMKRNLKDKCKRFETVTTQTRPNFDVHSNEPVVTDSCSLIGLDEDEGGGYVLEAIVGNPGQKLKLLIDTTSAYLAVIDSAVFNDSLHFRRDGSRSLVNESDTVDEVLRFGTWRGQLSTDLVSFPQLHFDDVFRSKVVLINETRNAFYPNGKFHGILGLSYPKDMLWNPFSYSNAWIDSIQRNVEEKDVAVLLEFCGTKHNNRIVERCGYFDILENNLERPEEVSKLRMLVTRSDSEWVHEFKLLGVKIETELLKIVDVGSRRTQIDTTTTDIHLPTEIFSRFVLLMILRTEFPVDDSFWYGGDGRCWKDMMLRFPRVKFHIEYDAQNYFVVSIPPQNYLRPVAKVNATEPCYRFAFQASTKGNFFGLAGLEGMQVILGRRNIGFMRSPHCGPDTEMWGPTHHFEQDRIRDYLEKSKFESFYLSFVYMVCILMSLFFMYLCCVCSAEPGWVCLTKC